MTSTTDKDKREAWLRGKAQWFAKCVLVSNVPCEIPPEIRLLFADNNEERRFERYLVHSGLFKRSDEKWQRKLT